MESTPFPLGTVELSIEGVKLPLLSTSNSADKTVYYFQWKTTDFPDGTYLVRPRATGTNGFAYQYGFGEQMTVANSSVLLRLQSAQTSVGEGDIYLLSGSFSDPGTNQATVKIDWGDGRTDSIAATAPAPGNEWQFTTVHAYLDDQPSGTSKDNYSVHVEVMTDKVVASASATITVTNKPPVITSLNLSSNLVSTGATVQATIAFTDAGTDSHSATWSWGDGTAITMSDVISPLSASHIFVSPGVFTITNVIADDDRGSASATVGYVVARNPQARGGAGVGQIYARLCDPARPTNCTIQNARFGFVVDEETAFYRARFTLPGLDAYATSYLTAQTNAAGQLEVDGPCVVNGISALNVVLTNTYQNVTESYLTNGTVITTNSVTNLFTTIETNTATFALLLRAAQAPSNTFQVRISARVGTNDVAQTLETDPGQPVRSGAISLNNTGVLPVSPLAPAASPTGTQTVFTPKPSVPVLKAKQPAKKPKAILPKARKPQSKN